MKKAIAFVALLFTSGCAAVHSPHDLYEWCLDVGSARLTSIGAKAHDPATCEKELVEDLDDRTPRLLYLPRDVIMAPITAGRLTWSVLGLTRPPF